MAKSRRPTTPNKPAVEARIRRQLGVERGGEQVALPRRDDSAAWQAGQGLGFGTDAFDQRRANKNGVDRPLQPDELVVSLEAVDLTPEGIALDRQIHQADAAVWLATQNVARQQNHAGARAPDWHALLGGLADRRFQTVGDQQFAHGGAFAAGHDQAVEPFQVAGGAYLAHLDRRVG